MITLPHTGMRAPTDRIRVTSLKEVDTGDGIAWTAVLRADHRKLGTLGDHGRGGATQLYPVNSKARQIIEVFTALCRDRDGEPISEEFVLAALAEEYEWARDVAKADRTGHYLVRYFDRIDIPGSLPPFTLAHATPPDYAPALKATELVTLPPEAVRAELWMGERGWVEFHRTAEASE